MTGTDLKIRLMRLVIRYERCVGSKCKDKRPHRLRQTILYLPHRKQIMCGQCGMIYEFVLDGDFVKLIDVGWDYDFRICHADSSHAHQDAPESSKSEPVAVG